jgi:ribonucleoside-diphosphate reductase alpha chain
MTRERLPNRRESEILEFNHEGNRFTLGFSQFHDGRIAEIFISSNKPGSALEAVARDAAIVASLALQHGTNFATIRNALTRDDRGGPATLLSSALDALAEGSKS